MQELRKEKYHKFMMLLLFYAFIILGSCRKLDISQEANEAMANSYEEKFFNSNRTSDSKENAIINFVKKLNEKENFVPNAIRQIGYPRWNKMVTTFIKTNSNSFASSEDSSNTYYIPFVRDSQNFVNATLVISTTNTDTLFRFKYDWQYTQMQNSPNSVLDSAENFAIFFMKLDKAVFGYNKFKITDANLFKLNNKSAFKVELLDSITQNNLNEASCTQATFSWIDCSTNTCTPDDYYPQCVSSISWTYCTGGGGGGDGGGSTGGGLPTGGGGTSGGGCGSCGGGGGSGPGWTNFPPIPITTVFCDSVNAIAQNANFRTMFQNLKNQVPTRKENMYILPQNLSQIPTLYSGQDNEFEIYPLPPDASYINSRGWIHSHFADADSAGLIFSAGDINSFVQEILDTSNFHNDYNNYMIGVVGDSSTQYMLSVNDIEKFRTWANIYNNELMIGALYGSSQLTQKYLPLSVAETEKRFLIMMKFAGLQLYKGTNDFKKWSKLNLNANGTGVNSVLGCD